MTTLGRTDERLGPEIFRTLAVGMALFALAGLTFGLSRLHLGSASLWIALAIAIAKSLLIVLVYMRLLQHHGGSRLTLLIAVTFLVLLITLVLTDVGLRFKPAVPPGPIPMDLKPLPSSLTRTPLDVRPSEEGREHPDQGLEGP